MTQTTTKRGSRRANGEGGLHQVTKNGRRVWKATVYLPDGSEKTATAVRKTDAAERLKELRDKWLGLGAPTDETVADYLAWWLDQQRDKVTTGEKDSGTVNDYALSLGYVTARLGKVKLIDLTSADVYDLLVHLARQGRTRTIKGASVTEPLSRRTVTRVRSHLDMALRTDKRLGKVTTNVAADVEIPATAPSSPRRALGVDQAKVLIEEAEGTDTLVYAFLLLGFTVGLRPGENLGARWDCLDWHEGTLEIEKTLQRKIGYTRDGVKVPDRLVMGGVKRDIAASKRTMTLPPQVLQALRRWQVEQKEQQLAAGPKWKHWFGLIFTSEVGTPISSNNMARRVNVITERLGLGHWSLTELTRHSFATLIEGDLAPQVMEKAMGHSVGSSERKQYIHRDKPVVTEHLEPMARILGEILGEPAAG
jgi:integrase